MSERLSQDGCDLLGPAGHCAGVQPAGGGPGGAPGPRANMIDSEGGINVNDRSCSLMY